MRLVQPALLQFGTAILLPVFTSKEAGLSFEAFAPNQSLHLVEMRPTTMLGDNPAFSFALTGLSALPGVPAVINELLFAIDPTQVDLTAVTFNAKLHERLPLARLLDMDPTDPLLIPQAGVGVDRLYVWRKAAS